MCAAEFVSTTWPKLAHSEFGTKQAVMKLSGSKNITNVLHMNITKKHSEYSKEIRQKFKKTSAVAVNDADNNNDGHAENDAYGQDEPSILELPCDDTPQKYRPFPSSRLSVTT